MLFRLLASSLLFLPEENLSNTRERTNRKIERALTIDFIFYLRLNKHSVAVGFV